MVKSETYYILLYNDLVYDIIIKKKEEESVEAEKIRLKILEEGKEKNQVPI